MSPASRDISPDIVGSIPGLGSLMRSRSPGTRFFKEPVVISDDFDFDDFGDSEKVST